MTELLSEVLGRHLTRSHSSVNRIASLAGVPKQTISNWLESRIKKPRRWQDVIKVATALQLSVADTNALLKAAGYAPIDRLRSTANETDQSLLNPYKKPFPHTTAPFQVIRDLPTFVGRDVELAELQRALLRDGHAAICGVRGMGGVGKTSLAAHLAYQLREEFTDGVLWARVDTSDAVTILAQFADAFGKDVHEYHDLDSRAAVVRNLLRDKHVLIILDNAESSDQVHPLLPPSTGRCAVLITTRHDLSVLNGWPCLMLQPFEDNSSEILHLFERFLGCERTRQHWSVLSRMAEIVGRLPLALAIMAGRLQAQPDTAVRNFFGQLQRSDARLNALTQDDRSIRASFDVLRHTCAQSTGVFCHVRCI